MAYNIGRHERFLRFVAGLALLIIGSFAPLPEGWRVGVFIFGSAILLTGLLRFCPLWKILGIDTSRPHAHIKDR